MTTNTSRRGWARAKLAVSSAFFFRNSRKSHYFVNGTSLCKNYVAWGIVEYDDSNHDSPDNCVACCKQLAKLAKKSPSVLEVYKPTADDIRSAIAALHSAGVTRPLSADEPFLCSCGGQTHAGDLDYLVCEDCATRWQRDGQRVDEAAHAEADTALVDLARETSFVQPVHLRYDHSDEMEESPIDTREIPALRGSAPEGVQVMYTSWGDLIDNFDSSKVTMVFYEEDWLRVVDMYESSPVNETLWVLAFGADESSWKFSVHAHESIMWYIEPVDPPPAPAAPTPQPDEPLPPEVEEILARRGYLNSPAARHLATQLWHKRVELEALWEAQL